MENNNEEKKPCTITLEQAKKIINSDVDNTIKELIKSQINDYELGITTLKEEFEKVLLDLLDYTKDDKKVVFLGEDSNKVNHPTNRYEIRNSKGMWLFDISYNSKKPHFWYSYNRIYPIFKSKFNLNEQQISDLMKDILEKHSICKEITLKSLREM